MIVPFPEMIDPRAKGIVLDSAAAATGFPRIVPVCRFDTSCVRS